MELTVQIVERSVPRPANKVDILAIRHAKQGKEIVRFCTDVFNHCRIYTISVKFNILAVSIDFTYKCLCFDFQSDASICYVIHSQSLIGYVDRFTPPIGSCFNDAGVTWGSRNRTHKTVSLAVSVNRT